MLPQDLDLWITSPRSGTRSWNHGIRQDSHIGPPSRPLQRWRANAFWLSVPVDGSVGGASWGGEAPTPGCQSMIRQIKTRIQSRSTIVRANALGRTGRLLLVAAGALFNSQAIAYPQQGAESNLAAGRQGDLPVGMTVVNVTAEKVNSGDLHPDDVHWRRQAD